MKKTKNISPKQYGALTGIKHAAVTKRIRLNVPLPGVLKIEKFGRVYLLNVYEDFTECPPNVKYQRSKK